MQRHLHLHGAKGPHPLDCPVVRGRLFVSRRLPALWRLRGVRHRSFATPACTFVVLRGRTLWSVPEVVARTGASRSCGPTVAYSRIGIRVRNWVALNGCCSSRSPVRVLRPLHPWGAIGSGAGSTAAASSATTVSLAFALAFGYQFLCLVLTLHLYGGKGTRPIALVPIVQRSSFHNAFLHFGGCEVLDTWSATPACTFVVLRGRVQRWSL